MSNMYCSNTTAYQSIEGSLGDITNPAKSSATPISTNVEKVGKKPRRRARARKSATKKDMATKQALISEIESVWGKGFVESRIPKCHRPYSKDERRRPWKPRTRENDPMEWSLSILTALARMSKITNDKQKLKDIMNQVVRYRIKYTGNHKPQLTLIDFDVMEDMLVKQWNVAYSCGIRYKHQLEKGKGREEPDESIDYILRTTPDPENREDLQDATITKVKKGNDDVKEVSVRGNGMKVENQFNGLPSSPYTVALQYRQAPAAQQYTGQDAFQSSPQPNLLTMPQSNAELPSAPATSSTRISR